MVRQRVLDARERQRRRGALNAMLSTTVIERFCELDAAGRRLAAEPWSRRHVGARRPSRDARRRTIAVSAARTRAAMRLAEALQYRAYEARRFFAR